MNIHTSLFAQNMVSYLVPKVQRLFISISMFFFFLVVVFTYLGYNWAKNWNIPRLLSSTECCKAKVFSLGSFKNEAFLEVVPSMKKSEPM